VLSALLAPDAMRGRTSRGGGGWPTGGGGGGMGGPLGGIILGRRGPYGGGGGSYPPSINLPRTSSAGTAEIARRSGGDSMQVDDAAALETTLTRIRQRYTLHFNLPEGVQPGQERGIDVQLADAARRRYPNSEVRFRRIHQGAGGSQPEPVEISRTSAPSRPSTDAPPVQTKRRRPAVNEDGTRADDQQGGWRRADEPEPAASAPLTPQPASEPQQGQGGGWRRVKPGEQP
jgi:hypothetical protein